MGTSTILSICSIAHLRVDAPNFFESSFWSDFNTSSGIGGWGDPNNDYQVPTGGFSDFYLVYPSPHILRRNFTLQPYLGLDESFFTQPDIDANATFTVTEVDYMVNNFKGDFKGFQMYLEGFEVRTQKCLMKFLLCSRLLGRTW